MSVYLSLSTALYASANCIGAAWLNGYGHIHLYNLCMMFELGNFCAILLRLLIDLIGNLACTIKLHVIIYYSRFVWMLYSPHFMASPISDDFKLSNFPLLSHFVFRRCRTETSTYDNGNDDDGNNWRSTFVNTPYFLLQINLFSFTRNFRQSTFFSSSFSLFPLSMFFFFFISIWDLPSNRHSNMKMKHFFFYF